MGFHHRPGLPFVTELISDVCLTLRQSRCPAPPNRSILPIPISQPLPSSAHPGLSTSPLHSFHLVAVQFLAPASLPFCSLHIWNDNELFDLVELWSRNSGSGVGMEEWKPVHTVQRGLFQYCVSRRLSYSHHSVRDAYRQVPAG